MAAPADITIKKLDGQWVMNRALSADYDAVLKLQGINWLMRKVLNMASVVVTIKQWEDPTTGLTHMDLLNTPSSGLPSNTEVRVLNFEGVELAHPLFGKVRSRTRYASSKDLDEVDSFLADGFEEGTEIYIQMTTEHLDQDVVTHQALGFEFVEGMRHHSRHIIVRKGDEVLRVKFIYEYIGPRPDES